MKVIDENQLSSTVKKHAKVSHFGGKKHLKVRHLKRLKLSCLKDDTAKSAGEMLLQIARSSAGFAGASAY